MSDAGGWKDGWKEHGCRRAAGDMEDLLKSGVVGHESHVIRFAKLWTSYYQVWGNNQGMARPVWSVLSSYAVNVLKAHFIPIRK